MLFLLVTSFSFILFLKSLPLKPLRPRKTDVFGGVLGFTSTPQLAAMKKSNYNSKLDLYSKQSESVQASVFLDLPELALDCILEKLPPSGLCTMAGVCSSLRDRSTSDHFWEKHMDRKWARVLSSKAVREWQWFIARRNSDSSEAGKPRGFMKFILHSVWPLSRFSTKFNKAGNKEGKTYTLHDSAMSFYLALDSGKFWFPAQVYNRENGHIGFMLSCYDAELSYDHQTNTFQARYPPHGRRAASIESRVPWERLRASPVETSPHELYLSDCLNDLHPGDHIEIQWRRNKDFPYGWWYGVVGHLESCDGNEKCCRCHRNESVALEFNHYMPGSRWRRTIINRKDHRETGIETDGFYGGIRKLCTTNEISTWKTLWPREVLE